MAVGAFGFTAIKPGTTPYVLGFATALTATDDEVFEIWNGPTNASRIFRMNLDGQLQAQDGSAASPAYSFEDAKTTGVFAVSGTPEVGVAIAGSQVVSVVAAGVTITGTLTTTSHFILGDDDELRFGAGTDYWFSYDSANTRFRLRTTDNDGGGTDGDVFRVEDGTDDVDFIGDVSLVNLTITSFAANWTNAGRTVADLGIVTTADINGGTIDGATIGGTTAGAGTFTTLTATTAIVVGDDDQIRLGASTDYWMVYNSTGTQWEIWTTNADGIGSDGLIMSVDDGTDDVDFTGGITLGSALGVAYGGTGLTTYTAAGRLLYSTAATTTAALALGTGRQILQVNAGATAPEWASNIDIPGTLDVTGAVTLDSTLSVTSTSTFANRVTVDAGGARIAGSVVTGAADYLMLERPSDLIARITSGSDTVSATTQMHFRTLVSGSGADRLSIYGGLVTINDTSNANMAVGLTINGGANDDQHFALKNSDVATVLSTAIPAGVPFDVETDDFYVIGKRSAVGGCAVTLSLAESTEVIGMETWSFSGAPQTTDTTSSQAAMQWWVAQHDGANALVDMAADSNGFVWGEINSGGSKLARMLLKADDGELHLGNTTLVALDDEDDVQAVRSLQRVRTAGEGIRDSRWEPTHPAYNYDDLHRLGVVGQRDENGDFLIRVQPYLNLHDGAIWQLHERTARLEAVIAALPGGPEALAQLEA